jgi:exodeoxyribonuclease VII small subunit
MADQEHTFAQARARLEEIVGQVRKKDISLERSLDLLEEGVRLANACTEQIDQSEWRAVAEDLQVDAFARSDASSDAGESETGPAEVDEEVRADEADEDADESGQGRAEAPAEPATE